MARTHAGLALTSNTATALFTATDHAYSGGTTDGARCKAFVVANDESSASAVEVIVAPLHREAVVSGNPFPGTGGVSIAPGQSREFVATIAGAGDGAITQVFARSPDASISFGVTA